MVTGIIQITKPLPGCRLEFTVPLIEVSNSLFSSSRKPAIFASKSLMSLCRISRTPGSGYGSDTPFQYETAQPLMAVTALNAGCDVSSSFLPAERNFPSAPNEPAAWSFCWVLSVLRTPNQLNPSLAAAIDMRLRCAADGVAVAGSSRNMVIRVAWVDGEWNVAETSPVRFLVAS